MSKLKAEQLLLNTDAQKVKETEIRIEDNASKVDEIVNRLVNDYAKQLDDYVRVCSEIIMDKENPPTDEELDDMCMTIPCYLYFISEGQEALGLREDVAKAIKMELYNNTYEKAIGTIADKTATAELASQHEYIVHSCYQRAYKQLKMRYEIGLELLNSVKKVISRRQNALNLTGRVHN